MGKNSPKLIDIIKHTKKEILLVSVSISLLDGWFFNLTYDWLSTKNPSLTKDTNTNRIPKPWSDFYEDLKHF